MGRLTRLNNPPTLSKPPTLSNPPTLRNRVLLTHSVFIQLENLLETILRISLRTQVTNINKAFTRTVVKVVVVLATGTGQACQKNIHARPEAVQIQYYPRDSAPRHAVDLENNVFGDWSPRTASTVEREVKLDEDDDDFVQILYSPLKKTRAAFKTGRPCGSNNKKMAVKPARRVVAVKKPTTRGMR